MHRFYKDAEVFSGDASSPSAVLVIDSQGKDLPLSPPLGCIFFSNDGGHTYQELYRGNFLGSSVQYKCQIIFAAGTGGIGVSEYTRDGGGIITFPGIDGASHHLLRKARGLPVKTYQVQLLEDSPRTLERIMDMI